MKSKANLKFVVVFVVILFIAAGVGVLGYSAWQNKDKLGDDEIADVIDDIDDYLVEQNEPEENPDNLANQEIKPTAQNSVSINQKTGKENYAIEAWGLTGYYKSSYLSSYRISRSSKGAQYLEFFSASLPDNLKEKVVGTIFRLNSEMAVGDYLLSWPEAEKSKKVSEVFRDNKTSDWGGNWHIGEYYYVYLAPDASLRKDNDLFNQISIDVKNYFNSLVEV